MHMFDIWYRVGAELQLGVILWLQKNILENSLQNNVSNGYTQPTTIHVILYSHLLFIL